MSAYKLRRAARDDIKDIARYTAQEYGKTRRDKYLAATNLVKGATLGQFM